MAMPFGGDDSSLSGSEKWKLMVAQNDCINFIKIFVDLAGGGIVSGIVLAGLIDQSGRKTWKDKHGVDWLYLSPNEWWLRWRLEPWEVAEGLSLLEKFGRVRLCHVRNKRTGAFRTRVSLTSLVSMDEVSALANDLY